MAWADHLLADVGVRWVAFDRPGYGGSTPTAFSVGSVAKMALQVADQYGLERFRTSGWSGGGPFALGTAAIAGERVEAVGVIAGAGPFQLGVPPAVWLANATEAASVAELLIGFRNWYERDWPTDASFRASVDRIIARGDAEFLLGASSSEARPVAVCQLRFRHSVWTSADDGWIEDLFVGADARGAGIGAALLDLAGERARLRGCLRIELDASEENELALRLYHRHGFSEHSKTVAPHRELLLGLSLRKDL